MFISNILKTLAEWDDIKNKINYSHSESWIHFINLKNTATSVKETKLHPNKNK